MTNFARLTTREPTRAWLRIHPHQGKRRQRLNACDLAADLVFSEGLNM
jgi:hypothetical protein